MIPSPLFDHTPPPSYSYLQALSSFSAVVQLYIWSGQLDTLLSLLHHLSNRAQPWCCFSCHAIKDPHHVFIHCPHFNDFHDSATSSVLSSSTTLLDTSMLNLANHQMILERARGIFHNSDTWPAHRSLYYISVLPNVLTVELETRHPTINHTLCTRLTDDWHTTSIRLAVRIWSKAWRHSQIQSSLPRAPQKSISLPHLFQNMIPYTYPSLGISFH